MEDQTATGFQNNMRLVQETVPGKQITLAHVIANPDPVIYRKLGMDPKLDYSKAAIGIVTVTPSETSIICADIAIKSTGVDLSFVDRFSGTLIFTGLVAQVEQAMIDLTDYCRDKLGCTVCPITKT